MLNKRIPVYTETQDRLRDVAYGSGVTYDALLNYMLDTLKQEGENDLDAGLRLREIVRAHAKQHGAGDEAESEETSH
jgi:hypothetical protein